MFTNRKGIQFIKPKSSPVLISPRGKNSPSPFKRTSSTSNTPTNTSTNTSTDSANTSIYRTPLEINGSILATSAPVSTSSVNTTHSNITSKSFDESHIPPLLLETTNSAPSTPKYIDEQELENLRDENAYLHQKIKLLAELLTEHNIPVPDSSSDNSESSQDEEEQELEYKEEEQTIDSRYQQNPIGFLFMLFTIALFVHKRKILYMEKDRKRLMEEIHGFKQSLLDTIQQTNDGFKQWGAGWRKSNKSVKRKVDELRRMLREAKDDSKVKNKVGYTSQELYYKTTVLDSKFSIE